MLSSSSLHFSSALLYWLVLDIDFEENTRVEMNRKNSQVWGMIGNLVVHH